LNRLATATASCVRRYDLRNVGRRRIASPSGLLGSRRPSDAGGQCHLHGGDRLDRAYRPNAIDTTTIATSVLPNEVQMQWKAATEAPSGSGALLYQVLRNGSYEGNYDANPGFTDPGVSPAITYTYTIYSFDYQFNVSPAATVSVKTPPAYAVDPKQIGVRSTGAYWGGGGENIDMRSGNLNFTVPIAKAMGRGSWGVPFALSFNSQLWRQPWPNQPNAIGGIVDLPMQQTILGSFAFAVARIAANPKCADMFGGWDKAMTTLGNTNYRVMPLGGPALDARGMVTGTGAATFGPTDVWINSQGFFFDQNVFVPASGKFAYFDFGTGLSGNDWGALLLLHELGHQTGVFKPDAGSPGLNFAQTQSVLDNCFTSAGGGLYK
jgi:hypothetical protein